MAKRREGDNAFFCTSVLLSLKTSNCHVCDFESRDDTVRGALRFFTTFRMTMLAAKYLNFHIVLRLFTAISFSIQFTRIGRTVDGRRGGTP